MPNSALQTLSIWQAAVIRLHPTPGHLKNQAFQPFKRASNCGYVELIPRPVYFNQAWKMQMERTRTDKGKAQWLSGKFFSLANTTPAIKKRSEIPADSYFFVIITLAKL
ncbi:hypothetical protein NC99_32970 [Sunxiuqinia dokdonensis]|uniref:Uncharacterized protein n=1 Tax=Sunxiuqinia dokdonensis TaxID=1409788 RepID=A0A0L8V5U3_9BACT|nr:hypothetical protein NC99_32970 [Sunxiuqinia dokdonensis]